MHQIGQKPLDRGFTLIELLAVIAIVAIIAVLGFAAYRSVLDKVGMTTEVSAAKTLINAYSLYSADNNGQLLYGLAKSPTDITDKNGKTISKVIAKRWVPRLAAYFNYNYPGTVVVNEMRREYSKMTGKTPIMGQPADLYVASSNPSFGLNATFMGGNYQKPLDEVYANELSVDETEEYGQFFVSSIGQVSRPGKLIVFASARFKDSNAAYEGNEYIYAPRTTGEMRWASDFNEKDNSAAFGHVHPRWDNKAVTAMLDGSVKLMDAKELKDMRHWSYQAAETDDPNWVLQSEERVSEIPAS